MQCRKCHAENAEASKFCANCGHSFLPEHESRAPAQGEASVDTAQRAENRGASAVNPDAAHANPFSEFYSPQTEPSGLHRGLLIVLAVGAILGAATGAAYYFGHRKYEIAELAKLHASPQPVPAIKQDIIFPCPSATFCIGAAASKIKDSSCSTDKPIWAHYSEDDGATWKRAGCYATEAEARQGLNNALGVVGPATHKSASQPKKLIEKSEKSAAKPLKNSAPQLAADDESAPKNYYATFKGAFGITVEKRSYHSEQMKQKALDLWEREKKILEPDGSINDKYVLKPKPASGLIPGH